MIARARAFQNPTWFFVAAFFASAMLGVILSYNTEIAVFRFALIVVGIGAMILIARNAARADWLFAILPLLVLIYFGLTNDWAERVGKVRWLDPALMWLASWQPRIAGLQMDSNALGGVLAMLMPLQVAVLWRARRGAPAVILVGVSALGLVLSESRGAWFALAVIVGIGALWRGIGLVTQDNRCKQIAIFVAMLALIAIAGFVVLVSPLGQNLIARRNDRVFVWRNAFDLARDYSFTGLGLGPFEMAYSSYVLIVHVGHTTHAHNLFLDVWLEQGLLGLLAFIGLVAVAVLNALEARHSAALASLGVIVIHGFLDDPFYGYHAIALSFLFVPFALATQPARFARWLAPVFASVVVIVIGAMGMLPNARAQFEANLAALAQARTELAEFHWHEWAIQDKLRRARQSELAPIIAQYHTARVLDRANVSAHRRLGQIELSLGQYDAARANFEIAFAHAPGQFATRLLLGELVAIAGDANRAVELWSPLDINAGQLPTRVWWYEQIGEAEHAARLKRAIALLDDRAR